MTVASEPVTIVHWVEHEPGAYVQVQQRGTAIVDAVPFAEGGVRRAYRLTLEGKPGVFVAKQFLPLRGYPAERLCLEEMDIHHTAQRLARQFNALGPPRPVEFIHPVFLMRRAGGADPMLCEPYLEGEYCKHNCANGWLPAEPADTPQAFSHFTYRASRGRMLVVDLQGVGDNYTDPVVLTVDGLGFGVTNIGKAGMDRFFATHRCNAICHQLGLTPVS